MVRTEVKLHLDQDWTEGSVKAMRWQDPPFRFSFHQPLLEHSDLCARDGQQAEFTAFSAREIFWGTELSPLKECHRTHIRHERHVLRLASTITTRQPASIG